MEVLSRYHLVERVGATAVAERFRAYEVTSGGLVRPVLLARAWEGEPKSVQRLLDEARLLSMMSHPHVVRVVDVGHEEGQYFLVTEWLEGRPLATLLERARDRKLTFDPKPAIYVTMMVLEALAHVHERTDADGVLLGVVHAGVRPSAVDMGYQGEVVLGELTHAQARSRHDVGPPRLEDTMLRYASPEQALGAELDHRADLFAAGLLLYEMLAGRPAYDDHGLEAVRARAERAELHPIARVAPHVPPELAKLVDRSLAFDKSRRFRSAYAFRDALAPLLYGAAPTFGAHKLSGFVSMLLGEEAEEDRRKDHEARALLTTGGASAIDGGMQGPLRAGSEAQTLAHGLEVDTPAPVPSLAPSSPPAPPPMDPAEALADPTRKSSYGGRARAPTAQLPAADAGSLLEPAPPPPEPEPAPPAPEPPRAAPPPPPAPEPPPKLGASPSPSELAARHAPTTVPPPSLDHKPLPVKKIAAGLLGAAVVGMLLFTFSSSANQRLVGRKLRTAFLGRKPGATLTVESIPPGARLFLDEEDTGRTTPVTIENVESELVHDVRLELSGEPPVTSTVTLTAGAKKTLNLYFPNAVVNLSVKAVPEGSELWMNGRQVALTPASLTLRVGEPTELEVKRLGYIPWTKTVTPAKGNELDYALELEKTEELKAAEAAEKQALEEAAAEEKAALRKARRKRRRRGR